MGRDPGPASTPDNIAMPKDSLTITDNRTNKTYEIPITDGTIRGMDLRQIKVSDDDFGLMSYDPAFTNTASCRSAITFIDGGKGILRYRGYPIAELAEQATYLRLAHTLGEFLQRLHNQAQTLDVLARQRVVRLLVKEIVVGHDSITIRHSIPNSNRPCGGGPSGPADPGTASRDGGDSGAGSLLCTRRDHPALRCSPIAFLSFAIRQLNRTD